MKTVGALATYFEAMVYSDHRTDGRSSMEVYRTDMGGAYGKSAVVARVEQDRGKCHGNAYKKHFSNKNNSCVHDIAFDNRFAVVWNDAIRTDVRTSVRNSSQRTEGIIQNAIPRTLARYE